MKYRTIIKLFSTLFLFISPNLNLYAQELELEKYIYCSGIHFTVQGQSGITKFDHDPPSSISLESPLLTQNTVGFETKYFLKKQIYVSSSIGYLYTTHKNHRMISGMEWYNYRDGLAWLGYKKLDFGIGKVKFIRQNLTRGLSFKLGGMHRRRSNFLSRFQDGSRIQTNSRINYYSLIMISLNKILKNYNSLEFGFYYRHSFSQIYNGTYSDFPDPTRFSGRGSELGLNVGYSFTRYIHKLAKSKSKRNYIELKKTFRNINEKDRFIEISLDQFNFVNVVDDPKGVVVNSISKRFGIRIEKEFGIKMNRFWETGLHLGEFFTGHVLLDENKDTKVRQSQAGPDYQLGLSIGYGFRLVTKQEIKLLSISTGATINGMLSGSSGDSSLFNTDTNEYIYNIAWDDRIKSLVYPSVYLNINKDFQISKKMFLSLSYRYNKGFIKSIVRDYEVQTYGSSVRLFEGFRNGTSWSLGVGLKYNLGEKEPRNNNKED